MSLAVMFLSVLGLVLFFLAASWWTNPDPRRYSMIAGGLFCWLLADMLTKWPLLK